MLIFWVAFQSYELEFVNRPVQPCPAGGNEQALFAISVTYRSSYPWALEMVL